MTPRPQGSFRGFFAKQGLAVAGSTGILSPTYSMNTAIITFESTGNVNLKGKISLGGSGKDIASDSTGVIDFPAAISLNASGVNISQDSTGVFFIPDTLSMLSGSTAVVLAANSTGMTIGGAQISTA